MMKQNSARTFLLVIAVSASVWLCRAGNPSGSLFPYCYRYGKAFVLLGEVKSQGGASRWSCMGGKQDRQESLFDTALREGSEETKLVYGRTDHPEVLVVPEKLDPITDVNYDKLLKKSMNYFRARTKDSLHGKFTDPQKRSDFKPAHVVFTEVDHIPGPVFRDTTLIENRGGKDQKWVDKKKRAMSEMKEFLWFPLRDLNNQLQRQINDIEGYGKPTEIEYAGVKYTIRGPTVWDFSLPGFQAMVKEILSKEEGADPQVETPVATPTVTPTPPPAVTPTPAPTQPPAATPVPTQTITVSPAAKVDVSTLEDRLQALKAEYQRLSGELQTILGQR